MPSMFGNGENIDSSLSQPRAARVAQGVEGHPTQPSRLARFAKTMPEIVRNMHVFSDEDQAVIEGFSAPHPPEFGH